MNKKLLLTIAILTGTASLSASKQQDSPTGLHPIITRIDALNDGYQSWHFGLDDDTAVAKDLMEKIVHGAVIDEQDSLGKTPLMRLVTKGDFPRSIALLIEMGADVNKKCLQGATALHYAVHNCYDVVTEKSVKMLIDAGADIHAKTNANQQPLDFILASEPYYYTLEGYVRSTPSRDENYQTLILAGAKVPKNSSSIYLRVCDLLRSVETVLFN